MRAKSYGICVAWRRGSLCPWCVSLLHRRRVCSSSPEIRCLQSDAERFAN